MKRSLVLLLTLITLLTAQASSRQMEMLDRGLVAVKVSSGVFLSWRIMGDDDKNVQFNIYCNDALVNSTPISGKSNYQHTAGKTTDSYHVDVLVDGQVIETSKAVTPWAQNYLTVQLNRPPGGTTPPSYFDNRNSSNRVQTPYPDGQDYTYSPNDMSVADLDGDGEYELIVKWDPSNSQDNSYSGMTGNVYLDAYKLDGTQLWRIDLGINIRAGAHYTQFMVYDLDGDGIAELVCKTAPGTIDGAGNYVVMGNDSPTADYRNSALNSNNGYVLSGPEYLTLFDGATGAEKHTVAYEPGRGTVSTWGDNYGNRVDRFLACVAYLDGVKPSVVMCRGYYTRAVLVAYDVVDGKLVKRWTHDSPTSGKGAYGEGNHSIAVGDIDDDGYDEIVYGGAAIDHDGNLLYRTGYGHGDAGHLSDMDPDRSGLEWFQPHETKTSTYGFELRDAGKGTVIYGEYTGTDVGRGIAADIDPDYRGFEFWSAASSNVYNIKGEVISTSRPSTNFRVYWDGDLQDELLDGTKITTWNASTKKSANLVTFSSVSSCNSTKATPNLSADILGDWREEVILWVTSDPSKVRIHTTTTASNYGLYTLMHDPVYRMAIAWQNVAYNQPPHLGIYIGDGLDNIPYPDMYTVSAEEDLRVNKSMIYFNGSVSETTAMAIPVGGLSGDVEWTVGDPSVISITKDSSNPNKVTVSSLKQGTTTLTASLGGYQKEIQIVPYGVGMDIIDLKDLVYVAGENIIADTELEAIRIYNASGALMKTFASPDRVTTINMPQGLYIAEVIALDGARTTLKFFIR